jgi:hypothetical protein
MQTAIKREIVRTLVKAGRQDLARRFCTHRVVTGGVDLQYIIQNLKLLSDLDLADIDRSIKIADIQRQLDVYVSPDGKVQKTSLRLDFRKPINELIKQIQDEVGQKFGDIDFEAYKHLGSLVTDYYFRHKQGNTYSLPRDYSLSYLLNFVIYIVTGKVEKDFSRVIRDMEANGWKGMGFETQFDIEYMGARIKKFKNKRLDIKWPKASQGKQAQKTIEDWQEAERKSRERLW